MDVGPEARAAHKRAASLGIFALLLVGCAPNDELVGVSIMTSLIVLVPLAACLNALVHRLWRDARQVHRPSVREAVAVWLGTITLVLLLNLSIVQADNELVLLSCWIVGATYLTFFSIGIGGALALSRPWAFRVVWALPAVLIALLTLPLLVEADLGAACERVMLAALFWSGGLGFAGGALLLLLLAVSYRAYKRAKGPPEPPPPLVF